MEKTAETPSRGAKESEKAEEKTAETQSRREESKEPGKEKTPRIPDFSFAPTSSPTSSASLRLCGSYSSSPLTGLVAKILPLSAVDGPGNRAVIFLQGCDFDCAYCHNPETRDPNAGEPLARRMGVLQIFDSLRPYLPFVSGLTVSGGECGLQADFLYALIEGATALGLPTLVDTNGSTDYSRLGALVDAAQGFMLDLKAWDPELHRALTGADNAAVLANLRFLAERGKLAEVRTVVLPGLVDAEACVRGLAAILRDSGCDALYKLIRFRPQGVRRRFRDLAPPDDALMQALAELARAEGIRRVVVV